MNIHHTSHLIGILVRSIMIAGVLLAGSAPTPAAAEGEIVVTSTSGGTGGPDCTLRDAITAANTDTATGGCPAGDGPDTIILEAVTYNLTEVDNISLGNTALPRITSEIVILGNGATIRRNDIVPFRLVFVDASGNLTLDNVTLKDGLIQGTPDVDGRAGKGGAIFNNGTLTLRNNTVLSFNNANGAQGTPFPTPAGSGGRGGDGMGGAIFNNLLAVTVISNSRLTENRAGGGRGGRGASAPGGPGGNGLGGAIFNRNGQVSISNSTLDINAAFGGSGGFRNGPRGPGRGGAIYNSNEADVSLVTIDERSTLRLNFADDGAAIFNEQGSLVVNDSTFQDNSATGIGGGINSFSGTVTIDRSQFISNKSATGGAALYHRQGDLDITRSNIISNTSQLHGGGIMTLQATVEVRESTLSNNTASTGGGIFQTLGSLALVNSTLSGNQARHPVLGRGGAISASGAQSLVMTHTTTLSNSATFTPTSGIDLIGSTLQITGNIFGFNGDGSNHFALEEDSTVTSGGFNRETGTSGQLTATSDASDIDPKLGPLADNDGPTLTHLPVPDSPLLNQIPGGECAVVVDQRNILRPQERNCDIGAVEVRDPGGGDPTGTAPVAVDDAFTTPQVTPLRVPAPGVLENDEDPNGDPLTTQLVFASNRGTLDLRSDGSFTYTPPADFVGVYRFSYGAFDGREFSNVAVVRITVGDVGASLPPSVADDRFRTPRDTPLTVPAPGVLENDRDPNGDALTAELVNEPTSGTVTLDPNGGLRYTPDSGFVGEDSVTYRARDGINSAEGIVTIAVGLPDPEPDPNDPNKPGGGPADDDRLLYLPLIVR